MSDITIDGKEYKKEKMTDEQVNVVTKLANIQQTKNNLLSQVQDLEILSEFWVKKFKESNPVEEQQEDKQEKEK
tara:strand:- start:281 stop:502 length:222 start_codon:yes stop_codon:yes gene_type:complete